MKPLDVSTVNSEVLKSFRADYFRAKREYELKVGAEYARRVREGGREYFRYFNSGLLGKHGYFDPNSMQTFHGVAGYTGEQLMGEVTQLHEAGTQVLVVDLFGQGQAGADMGADAVIATSLMPFAPQDDRIAVLSGDGMSRLVGDQLLAQIDARTEQGLELHTVFFRPVGGIDQQQEVNLFVIVTFYQQLCALYERLRRGGSLFLQVPHQVRPLLHTIFNAHGIGHILTDQERSASHIHVGKDASAPLQLPQWSDVVRSCPSVLTDLMHYNRERLRINAKRPK
jgi:hypothetical protein